MDNRGGEALLIVDMQRDFCDGGILACPGANALAAKIAILSSHYDTVIASQDYHIDPGDHFSSAPDWVDSWPPHCQVHTTGVELHPDIAAITPKTVFCKGMYSAAYSAFEGVMCENMVHSSSGYTPTERPSQSLPRHFLTSVKLAAWLAYHNISHISVCGIALDFCVRHTCLDAVRYGVKTRLLHHYVASFRPENEHAVLSQLQDYGVIIDYVQ